MLQPIGTGFLVGERARLLATNAHVLYAATGGTRTIVPQTMYVSFKAERNSPQETAEEITSVSTVHKSLDLALLTLAAAPQISGRPPLSLATAAVAEGTAVAAVGYPEAGKATRHDNPAFLRVIFGDGLGVKRAAPGELTPGPSPDVLYHDCSTLSGNSGSPLLSLDDAAVLGVHFQGRFLDRNQAIPVAHLRSFLADAECPQSPV